MNRRKFLTVGGGTIIVAGAAAYLSSDKSNIERGDIKSSAQQNQILTPDEKEILLLASLAPSGHNTQPWFVQYLEPFHWIIGNDKNRWLPAVDPTQRETILSLGAFIQNLEYSASSFGYQCNWNILAKTNQDEKIAEVKLAKTGSVPIFDKEKIIQRRTVRGGYLRAALKKEDLTFISEAMTHSPYYLPADSKEGQWINEQTIEANRLQTYRDNAQQELSDWVRFSSKDAEKYRDGLTTASMEIEGMAGWVVRNFYGKADVMKKDFRERGLDKVKAQVADSAGWLLITSKNDAVETLLETGSQMERIFLKVRERGLAIHPMTQILEETATRQAVNQSFGISEPIQFILRLGYLKNYPPPVSLRRSVEWFIRK